MTSNTQAAEAVRQQRGEQVRQVVARRNNPLPPATFLVEISDRVAMLRVLGPGLAELATGNGPPVQVTVQAVKGGWLWRRRTRLFYPNGKRVVFPFAPGEYGIGEVGSSTSPEYSLWTVNDGLDLLVALPLIVWRLGKFIVFFVPRMRRRHQRMVAVRAIKTGLRRSD